MKTPVVSALAGLSLALGLLAGAAAAAEPCEVPTYLWFGNNDLKHVAEAALALGGGRVALAVENG